MIHPPVLGDPGALGLAAPGPPPTLSYSACAPGRSAATASTSSACSACRASPRRHRRRTSGCRRRQAASTCSTRGSLVHELLEELDLATGGPWAEGGDPAERLARVHEVAARHELELTAEEADDLDALVEVVARGELRARLAAATRVQREYGFAFPSGRPP